MLGASTSLRCSHARVSHLGVLAYHAPGPVEKLRGAPPPPSRVVALETLQTAPDQAFCFVLKRAQERNRQRVCVCVCVCVCRHLGKPHVLMPITWIREQFFQAIVLDPHLGFGFMDLELGVYNTCVPTRRGRLAGQVCYKCSRAHDKLPPTHLHKRARSHTHTHTEYSEVSSPSAGSL